MSYCIQLTIVCDYIVTSSVTYCAPPETLLIQQFDLAYFAKNSSILFNISAASVVSYFSVYNIIAAYNHVSRNRMSMFPPTSNSMSTACTHSISPSIFAPYSAVHCVLCQCTTFLARIPLLYPPRSELQARFQGSHTKSQTSKPLPS